jgi:hypothetical protein
MEHSQEPRRKQAVVRYLAGDKIEAICRDMNLSLSRLNHRLPGREAHPEVV